MEKGNQSVSGTLWPSLVLAIAFLGDFDDIYDRADGFGDDEKVTLRYRGL